MVAFLNVIGILSAMFTLWNTISTIMVMYRIATSTEATNFQLQSSSQEVLSSDEQNIADQCFASKTFTCNGSSEFRTFDGTCNNLNKPWWGSVGTPYVRLLKPAYNDNQNSYRVSKVDSSELPSARLLSSTFLKAVDNIPDERTRIFLVFSQLVSHDVVLNPVSTGPKCCSDSGDKVVSTSGLCRPITIPNSDPFFSQFGRQCQEYQQSMSVDCPAVKSPLQPISLNTHYIDVSFIYGTSDNQSQGLRSKQGGKLRTQTADGGKQFLPTKSSGCPFAKKHCYDAGDPRVNQHIDYTLMVTLFLRFHNFVADQLLVVNPSWASNDELIFQKARKIVIACFQHIVYNQWLPILVGQKISDDLGLSPMKSGFASGYNPNINPNTLVDFAGAAYRTLHTLTPSTIRFDLSSNTPENVPFSASVQRPGDFLQERNTFTSLLKDLLHERQHVLDQSVTEEITNKFLDDLVPSNANGQFGDDLTARDIQRGRDYGIRSYNDYRELCGGSRATTFGSLKDRMDEKTIAALGMIYKHVDDIDYYIGSLLEKPLTGTLSTPSIHCVFAEAFSRYKYGDRYYYEWEDQPGSFTANQLNAIKRVSLSTVVCATGASENIHSIQSNAFLPLDSAKNPVMACRDILKTFDLSSFKATN